MTMRDKIVEILCDELYEKRQCVEGQGEAADAILAALPNMIAPLVWEQIAETESGEIVAAGQYGIDSGATTGLFYVIFNGHELLDDPSGSVIWYETLKDAQSAANDHHRAAIMAAFTGAKP
jgi:hypothetical protein